VWESAKMMAGSVMLGDLNDFIAPSQACVNPLFAGPAKKGSSGEGGTASDPPVDASVRRGVAKIQLDSDFGGAIR
jgi:hypothetical protein